MVNAILVKRPPVTDTAWQPMLVKTPPQVLLLLLSISIYVVAAVRLLPSALTVTAWVVEVATKRYHTSKVVAAVAPPQAPVGATLVALKSVPVTPEHVGVAVDVNKTDPLQRSFAGGGLG